MLRETKQEMFQSHVNPSRDAPCPITPTFLEVEGVLHLRLAAAAAVSRLALQRINIAGIHRPVEGNGDDQVSVVPENVMHHRK